MSDLAWSQENVKSLIDAYRSYPVLWNVKHENYSNRNIKENCYKEILNILKVDIPEINLSAIKKRIHTMRSQFLRERKKVRDSKKSGIGMDQIYVSKSWLYNLLSFLNEEDEGLRVGCYTFEVPIDSEQIDDAMENDLALNPDSEPSIAVEPASLELSELNFTCLSSNLNEKSCPPTTTPPLLKKRRKIDEPQGRQLNEATVSKLNNLTLARSPSQLFGDMVGAELESLSVSQRIYAKKAINEVLFLGATERLTKDVSIINFQDNLNLI